MRVDYKIIVLFCSLLFIACSNSSNEISSNNNNGGDAECLLNNETQMAKTFEKGNGTLSDPYVIASPEQFKYFAEQVKLGEDFESEYLEKIKFFRQISYPEMKYQSTHKTAS